MSERISLAALAAGSTGFRGDARFALAPAPAMPEAEPHDPLAQAYADGFAAGGEAVRAEAEAAGLAAAAARERLALNVTRLDRELEEALRQRLRDTVAALCEAAIAPLALDEAALLRRIERAVAMLARADDERTIRLHPDDLAMVADGLGGRWHVEPDPALERGAIRIESEGGGVEDGPAQWRRALAEALRQC